MKTNTDMVRHFLATLAYRFQRVVRRAPEGFGDFTAGHAVRTPREIVRHMSHVMLFVLVFFEDTDTGEPEPGEWEEEIGRFHAMLGRLDAHLAAGHSPEGSTLEVCLQGPLADAMTHIGQIALLRRLAGSPVRGESFRKAEIVIGRIGPDQPASVDPY